MSTNSTTTARYGFAGPPEGLAGAGAGAAGGGATGGAKGGAVKHNRTDGMQAESGISGGLYWIKAAKGRTPREGTPRVGGTEC